MIMSQYRRTNSGVSYRVGAGYIFDRNGNIIGWCNTDGNTAADYEEQINELRAQIDELKQKQDKEELNTISAAPSIDLQVNTKQVERAADQVKKEIDRALKNLF